MRSPESVSFVETRKVVRNVGFVVLAAATLAGCSSARFGDPVFTGSTNNQKQILAQNGSGYGNPGAQSFASTPVQRSQLPPPAGGSNGYAASGYTPGPAYNSAAPAYNSGGYTAPQPASYPSAAPKPYTPPTPYAATGMPTPLGRVDANASAPQQGYGTQPTSPGAQAAAAPRPTAGPGGSYTVQSGDTLWNIAQRHGVSVDDLAAANGGSTVVKLGTRINIPGGAQPRVQVASIDPNQAIGVPATGAPPQSLQQQAAAIPAPAQQPQQPQQQVASIAPDTATAPAPAAASDPVQSAAVGTFRWPVRGRIISGFGKKPNGERNDGINLAVPEGTAVKAAEDGTVIYSGNELKSYGNLILVRHAGGWVSAYAHNKELKVARGAQVRRGEIVALSGMSGGVTTPQVHFELRREATPVDPISYLSDG
jgi:murein DD-endopeptidase MepM/ murein hydrolase activator NlpD